VGRGARFACPWSTGRGLLLDPFDKFEERSSKFVGREARFAVPDSGAHGEVCYSNYLPKLKSVASSIPEILKEFKICRQTNRQTSRRQTPLPTVKHYLQPPTSWRMEGNKTTFNWNIIAS